MLLRKVFLRHLHRFAGLDKSGEMHHGIDGVFLKQPVESGAIRDVSLNELRIGRDGSKAAFREIVINNHLVPLL